MWQAGLAVYVAWGTLLRYAVVPPVMSRIADGMALVYLAYWLWRVPKPYLAWRWAGYWLTPAAVGVTYFVRSRELSVFNGLLILLVGYLIGLGVIRLCRGMAGSADCCQ